MRKKSFILGLLLLFAGTVTYDWMLAKERNDRQQAAHYRLKYDAEVNVYLKKYNEWLQLPPQERGQLSWELDKFSENKTDEQLQQEQQERLKADLDKLASDEMTVYPFADVLYGENWQEELNKYKAQSKLRELLVTASVLFMATGGMICALWLLIWTARLIIRSWVCLIKFFAGIFRHGKERKTERPTENPSEEDQEAAHLEQSSDNPQSESKKWSKVLNKSGWQSINDNNANQKEQISSQAAFSMRGPVLPNYWDSRQNKLEKHSAKNADKGVIIISDENSPEAQIENLEKQTGQLDQKTKHRSFTKSQKGESPQAVQKGTVEHSEPLDKTLKELTQQVSAIRDYASQQQNRVEKLQDGYDWNIIRNFCLRIIRCIDNLENRIEQASEQNIETANLKEVKDEVVFALESSGVEQFEPEIESDYCGQERIAEAIKEKEHSDDPNLAGKIARIIRPGYQYFIDEDNAKIVRAAQVKLYG